MLSFKYFFSSDQGAHKESGEASEPALENEAPPPVDDAPPPQTKNRANGSRAASRQSKEGECPGSVHSQRTKGDLGVDIRSKSDSASFMKKDKCVVDLFFLRC